MKQRPGIAAFEFMKAQNTEQAVTISKLRRMVSELRNENRSLRGQVNDQAHVIASNGLRYRPGYARPALRRETVTARGE